MVRQKYQRSFWSKNPGIWLEQTHTWSHPTKTGSLRCYLPLLIISSSKNLIDVATTLPNEISNLLVENEEHSFLNIDLLNSNISGKSKMRWRKNISPSITTSTISELFKTLDFSSSLINVLLVVLLILPSIWHRLSGISVRG